MKKFLCILALSVSLVIIGYGFSSTYLGISNVYAEGGGGP